MSVVFDAPGPRARQRTRTATVIATVVAVVVVGLALWQLGRSGVLSAQVWSPLLSRDLAGLLLDGLLSTFAVAAVAILVSLAAGVPIAVARMSGSRTVRGLAIAWIEFFRGVPLLVLIFFAYLGPPLLGFRIPTFWSLVLGISLYNSVVVAEIYRSGILAVAKGQVEAALAIGLRPAAVLRVIQFPQALAIMSPVLLAQIVIILKETSLGFVVGYTELLRNGGIAVEYLGGSYAIPVYVAVGLLYLLINMAISRTARRLTER